MPRCDVTFSAGPYDTNVINKGVELNAAGVETNLMIETSGHGAMRENYNLAGAHTRPLLSST
jgi:hypothetical protein